MKRLFLALGILFISNASYAKESTLTTNFIKQVIQASDSEKEFSDSILIECPAPSASGTFLITKASYDFGNSLGVYVFKNGDGQDAKLDWFAVKRPNDDLSSKVVSGIDFAFKMPIGQFFLTLMKSGKVTAGVSDNAKPGIKEVSCKAIPPK